jgi:fatty-acyl-CoA synthase
MEAKVIDLETGADAPPGVTGELLFRGYARFEGYYKAPDLTAEAIDEEGWFHSQDLVTCDEHGRFRYAGRLKDMLKVGGENVSALEVEDLLASHDAIAIVQVVGAPDARYDEVPAAFVQLSPGASLTEEELIAFCIGQIATYKIPRYLRIVASEEWPMSGTKIQKFRLREHLAEDLRRVGISEAPKIAAPTPTEGG